MQKIIISFFVCLAILQCKSFPEKIAGPIDDKDTDEIFKKNVAMCKAILGGDRAVIKNISFDFEADERGKFDRNEEIQAPIRKFIFNDLAGFGGFEFVQTESKIRINDFIDYKCMELLANHRNLNLILAQHSREAQSAANDLVETWSFMLKFQKDPRLYIRYWIYSHQNAQYTRLPAWWQISLIAHKALMNDEDPMLRKASTVEATQAASIVTNLEDAAEFQKNRTNRIRNRLR